MISNTSDRGKKSEKPISKKLKITGLDGYLFSPPGLPQFLELCYDGVNERPMAPIGTNDPPSLLLFFSFLFGYG
jgi:hypothetical protein